LLQSKEGIDNYSKLQKPKLLTVRAKANKKFGYTPQSVVRALENRLKLDHEIQISDLKDKYESEMEQLKRELYHTAQTVKSQEEELK
jgi:hypothetical protein